VQTHDLQAAYKTEDDGAVKSQILESLEYNSNLKVTVQGVKQNGHCPICEAGM